jgi:hypothetical protein
MGSTLAENFPSLAKARKESKTDTRNIKWLLLLQPIEHPVKQRPSFSHSK